MPDRLIVLNGMAGPGKTTLAGPLAAELGIPLVSKDAIKEALGDAVGMPLPTRAVGALAADALWRMVGMLSGTVLAESVWLTGRDEEWFRRGWESAGSPVGVELWCEAPRAVMRERYLTRPRHAVHDDIGRIGEWEAAAEIAQPISGFPVIRVDTAEPVDIVALTARIRMPTTWNEDSEEFDAGLRSATQGYTRRMTDVAARDLRNNTASVLRRVQDGEDVTITVHGRPVARVVPIVDERRWMPAGELVEFLTRHQADPGLRADLADLAGETTDDLDEPW